MAWLLSREVVIVLAVLGGAASLAAAMLRARGAAAQRRAASLGRAGYFFMWVSIALFIVAGFRS